MIWVNFKTFGYLLTNKSELNIDACISTCCFLCADPERTDFRVLNLPYLWGNKVPVLSNEFLMCFELGLLKSVALIILIW